MHESSPPLMLQLLSRTKFVFGVAAIVAALAIVASLFLPLQYSASAGVFVIPRQGFGVDPYTVIKSAERVGENLARAIETSAFLTQVLQNEPAIDTTAFPALERSRRKFWRRTIDPQVAPGSGLLLITAYSTDRQQAEIIAGAVARTVMASGIEYVGPQVNFKLADSPVATRLPVRPNVPVNALLGFLFGLIFASIHVLFAKARHYHSS